MRVIGNILWLLFGGIVMALGYVAAGLLAFLLIVTIPFGIAAFRLASFTLWPFGRTVVRRADAGAGSFIGNVLWFLLFGWWLALGHVGAALLSALTIIGIPFAVAHLKLAAVSLWPLGSEIVPISSLPLGAPAITVGEPRARPPEPDAAARPPE